MCVSTPPTLLSECEEDLALTTAEAVAGRARCALGVAEAHLPLGPEGPLKQAGVRFVVRFDVPVMGVVASHDLAMAHYIDPDAFLGRDGDGCHEASGSEWRGQVTA
jgi:hypothetical protein